MQKWNLFLTHLLYGLLYYLPILLIDSVEGFKHVMKPYIWSVQSNKIMENIVRFDTIKQYNAFNNNETLHPLVSVIDMSKADKRGHARMNFGFYVVFLKE